MFVSYGTNEKLNIVNLYGSFNCGIMEHSFISLLPVVTGESEVQKLTNYP